MSADAAAKSFVGSFELSRSSRFRLSKFYPSLDGATSRWPYGAKTFAPDNSDLFRPVSQGEEFRWDLISFRIYGSTFFYWVILLANTHLDPFLGPEVGEILRVPTLARVLAIQQTT